MRKEKIGLLIGRFQPFHKGHLYLLKRALKFADGLIIGIGSANRKDSQNPYSYQQRKKMLQKVISKEKLQTKIRKIVPLDDFLESDDLWLQKALDRIGRFDVMIGNDDWTDGIFEKAGFKVLRLGFYKRNLYEGVKIRKLMGKNLKWENRVSDYLIKLIKDERNTKE